MLDIEFPELERESGLMPSYNHSYICGQILKQLYQQESFTVLPELTLNIGKGLTPDICIYPGKTHSIDFQNDIIRFPEMPLIAIEVLSPQQTTFHINEKARQLIEAGVKVVWVIDIYAQTVVVIRQGYSKVFHHKEVESEGVIIDFQNVFQ